MGENNRIYDRKNSKNDRENYETFESGLEGGYEYSVNFIYGKNKKFHIEKN